MSTLDSSSSPRFFAIAGGVPFAADEFSFRYPIQSGYYAFPAARAATLFSVPAAASTAYKMNLVRSLVSSKRNSSAGGARELQISHPQAVNQQLSIDTSRRPSVPGNSNGGQSKRGSLIIQSPGPSHHDFSAPQPQRQSQYFNQQGQTFYPTPQPNNYAFPGAVGSPTGPTSPGFQLPTSPRNFGQMPTSPGDYPTPGATPLSTPRYVLPSVVATQMEMDSLPAMMQQHQVGQPQQPQQHPQQPPPPPPPGPPPMPVRNQADFTLSDSEWQEALRAQQEYEWQTQMQQQIAAVKQQQQLEQEAQRNRKPVQDDDMFDERSFYDMSGSRRNTLSEAVAKPIRPEPVNTYSESSFYTQQQERRTSAPPVPKKILPEEEFYSSVNLNRTSAKPAQFTPDSDTPEVRRYEEPPRPKSFSVEAISTHSYPVPVPLSASLKAKEQSDFTMITNRFPNWFMDGTPLPDNDEDRGSHGPLAKRRRTASEAERDSEQLWGVFYDGEGNWSPMWHRLVDGVYDYYHRMNCASKEGLDPQTLGQMWEDMGYNIEDNLYESQIRLAQSLFHPDPEDFISSLLTNYFSLLELTHVLEQPPIQPPPSFLPKCVNPEPPVPIPYLTREGFMRYMIHQTLLDPGLMHERFNKLLRKRPTGIVDPETSLVFVRKETGGAVIPRKSFPAQQNDSIEEVEEKVREWMRNWVKGEVEGWVGENVARQSEPVMI